MSMRRASARSTAAATPEHREWVGRLRNQTQRLAVRVPPKPYARCTATRRCQSISRVQPFPSAKRARQAKHNASPGIGLALVRPPHRHTLSPVASIAQARAGEPEGMRSHERHFDGLAWLATPVFTSVRHMRPAKATHSIHLLHAMPGVPSKYGSGEPHSLRLPSVFDCARDQPLRLWAENCRCLW